MWTHSGVSCQDLWCWKGPYVQCPPSHDGLPLQSCVIRACCDSSGAALRPLNFILCPVRWAASAFEPCLCCFACLILRIRWPVLIVDLCKTKAVVIVGTQVAESRAIPSRHAPASSRLVLHKQRQDILTITGNFGRCLRSRPWHGVSGPVMRTQTARGRSILPEDIPS
jgi:hypothetical protein